MGDKEYYLLSVAIVWIASNPTNLLHEECLILRMQIEFRFVDDEELNLWIVEVVNRTRSSMIPWHSSRSSL